MGSIKSLAPICLFVYSRLNETKQTVESLQRNILAPESELFIFSDGEKDESNRYDVSVVRKYIHTITGFKSVTIFESKFNKGLANSIISGVTQIVNQFGKVIVLEDDLILSRNFLNFMNEALNYYKHSPRILNVSGYSFDLEYPEDYKYDVAFAYRFSSWGWGTWKDRWEQIDWEMKDYPRYRWNILKLFRFMRGGSDLVKMLRRQMQGEIDSWAIRFDYHHFKHDLLDVFPVKSKVLYNGFTSGATHTNKKVDTYNNHLDDSDQIEFNFLNTEEPHKIISKQFYNHYSLSTRLKNKCSQAQWIKK